MKEKNDATKLEFLLTLNENIVVQRYFNVSGYNPNAKSSIELYEVVKSIYNTIHMDLKEKTVDYMLEKSDEIFINPEILNTSNTEDDEYFMITIKNGDMTICQRIWDGKLYPPKIRYTVDVRPHIKSILRELTDIFSDKNLSYTYMEYPLV